MQITKRITPNKNIGRNKWKPDMIVCHITEGGYAGSVEWLCNPQSGASAHFVVARDGRVTQLVEIGDTAWGNGTSSNQTDSRYYGNAALPVVRERKTNANYYTVSIEHEGYSKDTKGALTETQLAAVVALISYIRTEIKRLYGINIPIDRQHIVGHCEIAPKWKPGCPGEKYPYDELIKRLIAAENQPNQPCDTPVLRRGDKGDSVSCMQRLLAAAGYTLEPDGSFGPATEAVVTAYQQSRGLAVDGVCGPKTWSVLLAETVDLSPEETTVNNAVFDGVISDRAYWIGVLTGTIQPPKEYIKTVFDRYHALLGKQ